MLFLFLDVWSLVWKNRLKKDIEFSEFYYPFFNQKK